MISEKDLDRWVDALRRGEYLQCFGSLHLVDEDGDHHYCSLGVLAEVMEAEWWVHLGDHVTRLEPHFPGAGRERGVRGHRLPEAVVPDWIQDEVIERNDLNSERFYQIADWLDTEARAWLRRFR
jgi:hypothetical protein